MDRFETAVNAARVISAEMIEKAKSGHPGLPLGAATIALTLYSDFLKFNPKNPSFFDRDRFVLSSGHGSALLYSLLYMFGYKISKSDLENFRQTGSLTPGHPEFKHTPGVEVSTGPLGQGLANAVGMAIAERRLAAEFNREGYDIVDHYTYALCGEGCLMEGIGYEACSLAGSLGLGKLILFFDCNKITIEGTTDGVFDEDIAARQKALGWQVLEVDGNNHEAIKRAVKKAQAEKDKPSMIICHTVIGYGSALAGSAKSHGAPLGEENVRKLRETLNYTAPAFEYPSEIKPLLTKAINRGKKAEKAWKELFAKYEEAYPELAAKFNLWLKNDFSGVKEDLEKLDFSIEYATRKSGNVVMNAIAKKVENLMGGSADLAPSNLTFIDGKGKFTKTDRSGNNIQYGIREHAMGAIVNGILCHGGLRGFSSTFFVFSDYMKNAVRMAAIMDIPAVYVFTHDSIGVGEDGPTHQPVEQLIALRSIPNVIVYRPCDTAETAAAWYTAITTTHPTAICLSRQKLGVNCLDMNLALKGGYVLVDSDKKTPDCILIASGSEVDVAVKAREVLKAEGIDARVISMPSIEVFEAQSEKYKQSVLPRGVKARVCIEAASPYSWYKYAGDYGKIVAMESFGLSGKPSELFARFGFTPENVAEKAKQSIAALKEDR